MRRVPAAPLPGEVAAGMTPALYTFKKAGYIDAVKRRCSVLFRWMMVESMFGLPVGCVRMCMIGSWIKSRIG